MVIIGKIVDFHVDHEYNQDAPLLSQRHEYNAAAIRFIEGGCREVANAQLLSTEKATGTAEKRTTLFQGRADFYLAAVRRRPC